MYAIKSKLTHQWLYGTDYRESPPIQRLSNNQARTYETRECAEDDMRYRKCNDEFEVVKVELEEVGD